MNGLIERVPLGQDEGERYRQDRARPTTGNPQPDASPRYLDGDLWLVGSARFKTPAASLAGC